MNADFVLSATIALKDNFTAQVNKAKSGFRDFERSLRGASATRGNGGITAAARR